MTFAANRFVQSLLIFMVLVAWIFCGLCTVARASSTETFIFLCEAEERRLEIGTAIINEIRDGAEAGDYFHVVSTPSHDHVMSLEVPVGSKASRLKRRSLVKELHQLRAWLAGGPTGESRQLRLYGLPETIANLRHYTNSQCQVVLVGDPVLKDGHYQGLNMVDEQGSTLVPLDGWLDSGGDSPFAPSLYSLPEGTAATWITKTSLWGPTSSIKHRQGIIRFYRLWFENQNDSLLARFSSSPAKAFDFTPDKGFARLHQRDERADMAQVSDATEQHTPAPAAKRKVRVIPEQRLLVESKQSYLPGSCWPEFLEKHRKQVADIAIVRLRYVQDESPDTATDVDLHLVDSATGKEAWFEHPLVSGLGRLYNDVRVGSSKTSNGEPILEENYEFVCIAPERDLKDCTLWVNKYLGVGEVVFEVSLLVNGAQVGATTLSFDTPKGDLGQDADNRGASKNWMQINLDELLHGEQLISR